MNLKLSNTSALQFFQLLRFGTFLLIGVVLAKSGIGTGQIGQYEEFLFLASGVSFFWLNGLIQALLPLSGTTRFRETPAVFNSFLLISLFALFAVALLASAEKPISQFLLGSAGIPFSHLLLAYLFFSAPANLVEYHFLIRNEYRNLFGYAIISFSALLLLVSVPVIMGKPLEYAIYGLLASAIGRYVYLLVLLKRHSAIKIDIPFQREHLRLSIPLILSALLSGSAQYVDGFIISSRFGEAAFAVFRYGARELPLVILLANAFSNAMLPKFKGDGQIGGQLSEIRTESGKLANWLFPLSALLMLGSHGLFPLIFNARFAASATIFNIYLLLIISRLMFPQTILIGLQKTRAIATASIIELATNIALSLWLVTIWGIAGVAYATVVAYSAEKLYLMFVLRKKLGIAVNQYQQIGLHTIYSLTLLLLFYLVEFVIY